MDENIKIWYDPEGDYVEIIFRNAIGVYEETDIDQVMKKVDSQGRVIAYSITSFSTLKGSPIELSLATTG